MFVDEYVGSVCKDKLRVDTDECVLDETEVKIGRDFDFDCVEVGRAGIISLVWLLLGNGENVTAADSCVSYTVVQGLSQRQSCDIA